MSAKRKLPLFTLLLLLSASCFLCACSKPTFKRKDCIVDLSLTNLPAEMNVFSDGVKKDFEIRITLQNVSTKLKTTYMLSYNNDFHKEIHLQSGIYDVTDVSASLYDTFFFEATATEDSLTVTSDAITYLHIAQSNYEAFTSHIQEMSATSQILESGIFSRLCQYHGKCVSFSDLLKQLNISDEEMLAPHTSITLETEDDQISLRIYNDYDFSVPFKECRVLELSASSSCLMFPKGVMVGSSTKFIANQSSGVYGEADSMSGTFYGKDYWSKILYFFTKQEITDGVCLVYSDPSTNDSLTLTLSPSGEYVTQINYKVGTLE